MLLSIITINYNESSSLLETLNSIRIQNYKAIQLIVIDGGSTDQSLEVIQNNLDIITFYLSEKDDGIYDAMNKGINFATGDFLLFLNSGDELCSDESLNSVIDKIDDKDAVYFSRAQNTYLKKDMWVFPQLSVNNDNVISWLKENQPNHQTILFPKSFYYTEKYKLKYKIGSDLDYKLRALKSYRFIFINEIFIKFKLGGYSSNLNSFIFVVKIVKEIISINIENNNFSLIRTMKTIINYFIKYVSSRIMPEDKFFKTLAFLKKS